MTLSPDETTLYVTNGNTNDVAVLSVAGLHTGQAVLGLIPTGWYANSVTFSKAGLQSFPTPGPAELAQLTHQVAENNHFLGFGATERDCYRLVLNRIFRETGDVP